MNVMLIWCVCTVIILSAFGAFCVGVYMGMKAAIRFVRRELL